VPATVAKWQGTGNAYLIVREDAVPFVVGADQARLLCHPRLGVGADGILALSPSAVADVRMRIVNPDGSASEACGNGTRMVARFVADGRETVTIETVAGILDCRLNADGTVTARLATARLDGPQYAPTEAPFPYPHRFVSVGNPHVAIRVDDPARFPLASEGPLIEHHPWLPERANVEVWNRTAPDEVAMRVWERGVGETDACGTGACAVAVAAILEGAATSPVTVHLRGGTLVIDVSATLEIRMTGPAEPIAEIELSEDLLRRLGA
jgi:diaminopimelate epimerase